MGVQPEFSTCFGSPFLPRNPSVYADLLRDYIKKHNVDVWLVNSGWTGGIYGVGRRMPIKATRTLVTAALNGSLKNADFRTRSVYFGFSVPTSVPGVEPHLPEPDQDLAEQGRVRQNRARTGRHVPEEFCQVRKGRDAGRQGGGAGSAHRRGVILPHKGTKKGRPSVAALFYSRPFLLFAVARDRNA